MLHLCWGHGVSCCLQAPPSICGVGLICPLAFCSPSSRATLSPFLHAAVSSASPAPGWYLASYAGHSCSGRAPVCPQWGWRKVSWHQGKQPGGVHFEKPSLVQTVMCSGRRYSCPGAMQWVSSTLFLVSITQLKEQVPQGMLTRCPSQNRDAKPSSSCPSTAAVLLAAPPVGKSSPLARFPLLLGAQRHADLLMTAEICEY